MLLNSDMGKGEKHGCKLFVTNITKYHCKISINLLASASYGNGTHVNSCEGYYALTRPTMLSSSVLEGQKHYGLEPFWSNPFWWNSNAVNSSMSYGTLTHVTSPKGYYATTSSTMLVNSDLEKENNRIVNSFVTNITAKFLSTSKLLHRRAIEPMSIAWKVTMLQLYQQCWCTLSRMVKKTMDINLSVAKFS